MRALLFFQLSLNSIDNFELHKAHCSKVLVSLQISYGRSGIAKPCNKYGREKKISRSLFFADMSRIILEVFTFLFLSSGVESSLLEQDIMVVVDGNSLSYSAVKEGNGQGKAIYLTFDDGPWHGTKDVLSGKDRIPMMLYLFRNTLTH